MLLKSGNFSNEIFNILLLLSLLNGGGTLVPEASQEGSLHAFKSYSDVATFHYTVPKEVHRATWQFAAFMDGRNCAPREVYIHLQRGSYPVMAPDNSTFPPNMYTERDGTIAVTTMTTYEAETTVIVPINSPEPGDWFVGAYMSHFDEKVQQQGLGHKCHYSIGSVAIWLQANGIQTIPIGFEKAVTTTAPSTYYKIFIPSGTWSFRVNIWGCKNTFRISKETSKMCMKFLSLRGRSLPTYNHTELTEGLYANSTYTFTELTPFEESYYYLLVVSDSIVNFNIKVSISECPVKITESTLMRQWAAQLNNNSMRMQSMMYKSFLEAQEENSSEEDPCARRFQLIRVKQLPTFAGAYLLQGREWLTPWIMLSEQKPVVAQFNILPLIDVGGSLNIAVHLEVDQLSTKQIVMLAVCVRRGRVPNRINGDIDCQDENMKMNLTSNDKHDGNLIIPYPQPDTWHVGLQAKCFSNGTPVKCDLGEILVSLDIRTRQCVFSGPQSCGHHGICQEIHRGLLHYTTCSCSGGYKGWGCTDGTDVKQHNSLYSLMLIISNAFFLPAISVATSRKLYTEALVYSATMLFSSLYHACDQQSMTYCIAKYEVLQYLDFFASILALWVTLVAMAQLPIRFISFCHMFGVLIIAFEVESDRTGLSSILVPLAIGVMIPIGTYSYNCYKAKTFKWPNGFFKLLIGLLLAGIGLILFASAETEANYQFIHSIWHMIIALSLIFLLPLVPVRPVLMSVDSQCSSEDSELLDLKVNLDSPVFTIVSSFEQSPTAVS